MESPFTRCARWIWPRHVAARIPVVDFGEKSETCAPEREEAKRPSCPANIDALCLVAKWGDYKAPAAAGAAGLTPRVLIYASKSTFRSVLHSRPVRPDGVLHLAARSWRSAPGAARTQNASASARAN